MNLRTKCILLIAILLTGCATAESMFNNAKRQDDIGSYEGFLNKYPTHKLASEARTRIDDLKYQEAVRLNTAPAYDQFMKEHPDSRHLEEAFNKMATITVKRYDYGPLIELQETAEKHNYMSAAQMLRAELDRYDIATVGAEGYNIAAPAVDKERLDSTETIIRIRSAVTTSLSDDLSTLLARNIIGKAINDTSSKGPGAISKLNLASVFNSNIGALVEGKGDKNTVVLYLFPENDDDEVTYRKGDMELWDRVDGYKSIQLWDPSGYKIRSESSPGQTGVSGDKIAAITSIRRSRPEEQVFSLTQGGGPDGKKTHIAIILAVRLQGNEELPSTQGHGSLYLIDSNARSIAGVSLASPKLQALIYGTARLPADRWIAFGQGFSAKSGELCFEGTRVFLAKGTQIARRR